MTFVLPDILTRPGRWALAGSPEGQDARLLAALARRQKGRGVLHVCRDDARMATMEAALRFFAPDLPVLTLPAWDCQPYDRVSPNAEIAARRMDTLNRLSGERPDVPWLLLTTVNAALQRLPQPDWFKGTGFRAAKGGRVKPETLIGYLGRNGYSRVSTVNEPGEYAVRGGLVDLFPPGTEAPYRLDFFGDEIENIRRFDPATQRTIDAVTELSLTAMSEVPMDEESIARFRSGYRELFGTVTREDPLYEAVSAGRRQIGMEHWLPLFFEKLVTVLDYVPQASVTLDHLSGDATDERFKAIADHYDARKSAMKRGLEEGGSPYKPLPPDRLYLTAGEWTSRLEKFPVASLFPFEAVGGPDVKVIDLAARPAATSRRNAPRQRRRPRRRPRWSAFMTRWAVISQSRPGRGAGCCSPPFLSVRATVWHWC
jgi:transcription-repair coupling factor (superfamily II helicase)